MTTFDILGLIAIVFAVLIFAGALPLGTTVAVVLLVVGIVLIALGRRPRSRR